MILQLKSKNQLLSEIRITPQYPTYILKDTVLFWLKEKYRPNNVKHIRANCFIPSSDQYQPEVKLRGLKLC